MESGSRQAPTRQSVSPSNLPVYDPVGNISRRNILDAIHRKWTSDKKALLIEAQAGQGKSTLAIEMLAQANTACAWHQLVSADGDPVQLLAVLTDLLKQAPGFSSPLIETMLAKGEINASGAAGALDLLIQDLAQHLRHDFYLVLDDIYLLEEFPAALAVLGQLLHTAPARLKLILISRRPILPALQTDCSPEQVLVIGNTELALTRSEVATLFNEVLRLPISTDAVHALHRATEGWVMGMMLVASKAGADGMVINNEGLKTILARGREAIPDYFIDHVLCNFPLPLRHTLVKLALLQEIPLELAQALAEVDDIEAVLTELQQRNFFVRVIDRQQNIFAFHHLFQDCLKRLLEKDFNRSEIEQVQCAIANWYRSAGQHEKALYYFIRGGDYAAAQQILQQVGMTLHAHNRIISLQNALARAADEKLGAYPWLAYYQGIVAVNSDPPSALPWFEQACEGFRTTNDELGELMALVQIIHFRAGIDGRHNLGYPLLNRAAELFSHQSERLEIPQRITSANYLLLGYTLFNTELDKADSYLDLGVKLAREEGFENLEAEARMCRFYRHIFAGDFRACRREAEASQPFLHSPKVSAINKGLLQLACINMLEFEGDFFTYHHHKKRLRAFLGAELVDRSVMGAFIRLWDIDMELGRGNVDVARENIDKAIMAGFAGAGAHLRSQYLKYHAFLLSLAGEQGRALAAAEESLKLRREVGGQYFETITGTILGATFARLGQTEKALAHFDWGLSKSEAAGDHYHRASLHAHRADLHLSLGNEPLAQGDIRVMLSLLRRHHYRYFYFSSPQLMARLLAEAVRCDIETDFARRLAGERYEVAIGDDGRLTPLLKFQTLGRLEVQCDGNVILRAADLSANQRQLLAMLLSAQEQQLHQEEVQAAFWPDAPADKARSSFDNLVSRLRKILDTALGELSAKSYLMLKNRVLCLENCRIDFLDFATTAGQGLGNARRKECWQADNALRQAMHYWQGEFLPGMELNDRARQKRQDLLLLYLEAAQCWSALLAADGQPGEATALCIEALQHEPTHAEINRTLYNLHVNNGDGVQARKALADYSDALKNHGFTAVETAEILDAFWTTQP